MEYRLLGLSVCAVSALAPGTLTLGNKTSEADSFAQLDRFVSAGGTLIDTADVYADGRSEQIIGRWLASRADTRERALGRPAVRSVILGARTVTQLDDNLAAGDLDLSEDETRLLDEASDPGAPDYPYGERGQSQRDRRVSGGRF
jgi:aryl-alcohol dehydrogenase-like predicted oxidoreductase